MQFVFSNYVPSILSVVITHTKYPAFDALGLRLCVVPTVTSFTLRIGGLEYPCNPFNGWFMETEITRDLLGENNAWRD